MTRQKSTFVTSCLATACVAAVVVSCGSDGPIRTGGPPPPARLVQGDKPPPRVRAEEKTDVDPGTAVPIEAAGVVIRCSDNLLPLCRTAAEPWRVSPHAGLHIELLQGTDSLDKGTERIRDMLSHLGATNTEVEDKDGQRQISATIKSNNTSVLVWTAIVRAGERLVVCALTSRSGFVAEVPEICASAVPDASLTSRTDCTIDPDGCKDRCDGGDHWACFDAARARHDVSATPDRTAVDLYQRACSLGHLVSCDRQAQALSEGRTVGRDSVKAMSIHELTCGKKHPPGCAELGTLRMGKGRWADAIAPLKVACQGHVAKACLLLGDIHKDHDESAEEAALPWWKQACDLGFAAACSRSPKLTPPGKTGDPSPE